MSYRIVSLFIGIVFSFYSCSSENSDVVQLPLLEGSKSELEKDSLKLSHFDFAKDISDDLSAYKTIVNIIRETGLAQNFVILPGGVKNVQAYIENNERILEYNPGFMEKLQGDTNWHGISILARQIGHHLSQHDFEGGLASIDDEIEADKCAGFVLFRMGASLDEAIKALLSSMNEEVSERAISKNSRLASLSKGWNDAKTLMTNDAVIITNISQDTTTIKGVISKKSDVLEQGNRFLFNVFLAIDKTMYFVDEEDVIFKEVKGKLIAIGYKKDSHKPGFNWIFMKGDNSYGVDLKGRLWAYSTEGIGDWLIVGQAVKLGAK